MAKNGLAKCFKDLIPRMKQWMEEELKTLIDNQGGIGEGSKLTNTALELIASVSIHESVAKEMVEQGIPEQAAKIFEYNPSQDKK